MKATFSHPHIPDETLSAYLDDAVSAEERAQIESALQGNPELNWRLETLRQTVLLLRALPAVQSRRNFSLEAILAAEQAAQAAQAAPIPADAAEQALPSTGEASTTGRTLPPLLPHTDTAHIPKDHAAASSWWQRLGGFFNSGSPLLRNAAMGVAALFVVVAVGSSLEQGGTMSMASAPAAMEAALPMNVAMETPVEMPAEGAREQAGGAADEAPSADAANMQSQEAIALDSMQAATTEAEAMASDAAAPADAVPVEVVPLAAPLAAAPLAVTVAAEGAVASGNVEEAVAAAATGSMDAAARISDKENEAATARPAIDVSGTDVSGTDSSAANPATGSSGAGSPATEIPAAEIPAAAPSALLGDAAPVGLGGAESGAQDAGQAMAYDGQGAGMEDSTGLDQAMLEATGSAQPAGVVPAAAISGTPADTQAEEATALAAPVSSVATAAISTATSTPLPTATPLLTPTPLPTAAPTAIALANPALDRDSASLQSDAVSSSNLASQAQSAQATPTSAPPNAPSLWLSVEIVLGLTALVLILLWWRSRSA